jgi:hypothetical protein
MTGPVFCLSYWFLRRMSFSCHRGLWSELSIIWRELVPAVAQLRVFAHTRGHLGALAQILGAHSCELLTIVMFTKRCRTTSIPFSTGLDERR